MGQLVPNFGEGGMVGDSGVGVNFVFGTPFFCLSRRIVLPGIFESGKKIGLDLLDQYHVTDKIAEEAIMTTI